MSTDDVVQRLGEFTGRRKFLSRVSAATLSAAFVVLGLPKRAEALVPVRCCNLCQIPGDTCCGARPVVCTWSWTCCHSNHRKYRCIECYCNGGDCDSDCPGVTTSRIVDVGAC
jgi:hypothetical protein